MEFLKEKFILVVIVAILAGGVAGFYIAKMQNPQRPAPVMTSWSGVNTEKLWEVMGKLNDIAK